MVRVNVVLNRTVQLTVTHVSTTCGVVIVRVKVSCITSVDGILLWSLIWLVSISIAEVITEYHTELTASFFSFLHFAVISINVSFQFNMLRVQALLYNSSDYHSDLQEAIKQNVSTLSYVL